MSSRISGQPPPSHLPPTETHGATTARTEQPRTPPADVLPPTPSANVARSSPLAPQTRVAIERAPSGVRDLLGYAAELAFGSDDEVAETLTRVAEEVLTAPLFSSADPAVQRAIVAHVVVGKDVALAMWGALVALPLEDSARALLRSFVRWPFAEGEAFMELCFFFAEAPSVRVTPREPLERVLDHVTAQLDHADAFAVLRSVEDALLALDEIAADSMTPFLAMITAAPLHDETLVSALVEQCAGATDDQADIVDLLAALDPPSLERVARALGRAGAPVSVSTLRELL